MLSEKDEIIGEFTNETQRIRGWGTVLDNEKVPPPKYLHADFHEIDHVQIAAFCSMSNREKFLFAYWAQERNSKRAVRFGFLFGFICAVILLIVFGQML